MHFHVPTLYFLSDHTMICLTSKMLCISAILSSTALPIFNRCRCELITSSLIIDEKTTGAYARPSIALMNAAPAPPPHLRSCRRQQPHIQVPQRQQLSAWPSIPMAFDPGQWHPLFPQGLQISPGSAWYPTPQTTQSTHTPPMLFATQPAIFDRNQSQQPVYQPAYVLSPQGILVPAQAPCFVPVMQHPHFQPNVSQVQSKDFKTRFCFFFFLG